jgi:hypothetical protein
MKTQTELIRTSESKSKTANYISLAKKLMICAQETETETGNIFVTDIVTEMMPLLNACKNADCEYTAYVNCNALEIWHSKIDEAFAM